MLEKTDLLLAMVPLCDCAPLVVAKEHGLFDAEGLKVTLVVEPSWANVRDKLAVGALDGAHLLAGMVVASAMQADGFGPPLVTGCSLNLNGNAITVSTKLRAEMQDAGLGAPPSTAEPLKAVIARRRAAGANPPVFASVYPFSSHHYELRWWMSAAGIDPDRDVKILVLPPPLMVQGLKNGLVDGFCVGEPWNTIAVRRNLGHVVTTKYDLWNNSPEKVLAVRADWAVQHPHTHRALIRAVLKAGEWLDAPMNREESAVMISPWIGAGVSDILPSLTGKFGFTADGPAVTYEDFFVFHRYAASFPWRSHAQWFAEQMVRTGQVKTGVSPKDAAAAAYRPDIYREAAAEIGHPVPSVDSKPEGLHDRVWSLTQARRPVLMGRDLRFDKSRFLPDQ